MEIFKRDETIPKLLFALDIPRFPFLFDHEQGIGPYDPDFFTNYHASRQEREREAELALNAMPDEELWELSETPGRLGSFALEYRLFDPPPWYAGGFGVTVYRPDYAHWAKMDYWSLEECACLSLGFRPEKLPKYNGDLTSRYDAVNFFKQRIDLILRAPFKTLTGAGMVSPAEFVSWAKSKGLEVPSEMLTAVDVGKVGPQTKMLSSIDKRQYDSSMKVILGLLASHYGYREGAISTEMKKDILSGLADLGLSLDPKTLNKLLGDAIGSRQGFEIEQLKRDQKDS